MTCFELNPGEIYVYYGVQSGGGGRLILYTRCEKEGEDWGKKVESVAIRG